MKKVFGTIFFLMAMVAIAGSQERKVQSPEVVQRMKAEKISFISARLDLTTDEAQVFWPVYNEFERKKLELEKKRMELELKTNRKTELPGDEELKKINDEYIATFTEEARLMQDYNKQFLKVLSIQKTVKLYEFERKFRLHMLQEFRHREQSKSDRPAVRKGTDAP
ncbi:MAG: hypothetical protein A2W90_23560 [Bacteroidetes bacterium GWF2_42_66]|nr:MAG: hypothetical protein A2W92_20045 [Bacteroidetes bacterium GWA2_42_15]OFY00328.1 MAG: hypothetical protein A2W89_14105 [Bacteroidetes bacterium GWE2_42_39]OFY47102.1 MAG: hypothetical protein A2W90_23560 [Bacteroidetes bacterium GWF2_42_66]HBL76724.1 hypothetical protein [Prolixibacteraceae bacterium]HCR91702.1 hypothetical protein [Prolixibacteraceae bacterium]